MRRALNILTIFVAVGVVCWLFPPFHVVPLKQAQAAKSDSAFNPAGYAGAFWTNHLLQSTDRAADAGAVLAALAQDPKTAEQRYGRSVGLGSSAFYFLRGTGTVDSVDRKGVGVLLDGSDRKATVLLQTGLIFGNALRDATGLLDASGLPNSQDFNGVSAELNRIVEAQVIPGLRTTAAVGRRVRFVGCAEVEEEAESLTPLKVIPIRVEFDEAIERPGVAR